MQERTTKIEEVYRWECVAQERDQCSILGWLGIVGEEVCVSSNDNHKPIGYRNFSKGMQKLLKGGWAEDAE